MAKIIENIKKFIGEKSKPEEDLPDDVTTDKYLRSLRRQRRLQLEEVEKSRLKQQIANFEKAKIKQNMYGLGKKPLLQENKDFIKGKIKKETFMFKDKNPILKASKRYKIGKIL